LEVSGGITEQNIMDYASARVDIISVGALTHSVKALDISLEVVVA
jgi:nicotinate-nucleotide pyrophosphorylase (carboxylating)